MSHQALPAQAILAQQSHSGPHPAVPTPLKEAQGISTLSSLQITGPFMQTNVFRTSPAKAGIFSPVSACREPGCPQLLLHILLGFLPPNLLKTRCRDHFGKASRKPLCTTRAEPICALQQQWCKCKCSPNYCLFLDSLS